MDIETSNQLYHHFGGQCQPGDIAPYVLVPGSKRRVKRFAELWDSARKVADFREFLIFTGTFRGVPISACSTGIGGTSVALAATELHDLGARTFIRVGVTGPLQPDVRVGDVTIATAAIRRDRISDFYLPPEIPALASLDVVLALAAACQMRQARFQIGVAATAGSFYCGEGKPGYNGYTQSFMANIADDFRRSGVLDWDTETATLFSVASALGDRAGRINGVLDNAVTGECDPLAEERAVLAALDAVKILSDWDEARKGGDISALIGGLPDGSI